MFLQSPEQQPSLDIYKKRKTVTAIAPALLEVAVNAMLSQEAVFSDRSEKDIYIAPAQIVAIDAEAQIQHIRKLADKARMQHGIYDYPAEDITEEITAFRENQQKIQPTNTQVISFPDQIRQANPSVDSNGRQAA